MERSREMIRSTSFVTLAVLSLLAGCTPESGEPAADTAAVVEVEEVRLGTIEQTLSLSGDVQAGRSVRVFSQVPDRLTEVLVDVGSRVEDGEVLARVRDEILRAGLEQIEANLRAARTTLANLQDELARTRNLHEEGSVSTQTLEGLQTRVKGARAQVEQLEAARQQARASLANATITAPFEGIVAERYLEAGDMAAPGAPLFRIVDMREVKILTDIPQERLGRVTRGLPVRVRVSGFPGEVFRGSVERVAPVLNPMTRMASAEIRVANPGERLRPGMFVDVAIVEAAAEDAVLIPLDAVVESYRFVAGSRGSGPLPTEAVLFRVEGDRVEQLTLPVGLVGKEELQVTEGLSPGDPVVTVGREQLTDGTRVRVLNREVSP
ncbi:MAG: efflux RND transporter periplasmic adaptor subunit [bacterium]